LPLIFRTARVTKHKLLTTDLKHSQTSSSLHISKYFIENTENIIILPPLLSMQSADDKDNRCW